MEPFCALQQKRKFQFVHTGNMTSAASHTHKVNCSLITEPLLQTKCIAAHQGIQCEEEIHKDLRTLASIELSLQRLSPRPVSNKTILSLLMCHRCKERRELFQTRIRPLLGHHHPHSEARNPNTKPPPGILGLHSDTRSTVQKHIARDESEFWEIML